MNISISWAPLGAKNQVESAPIQIWWECLLIFRRAKYPEMHWFNLIWLPALNLLLHLKQILNHVLRLAIIFWILKAASSLNMLPASRHTNSFQAGISKQSIEAIPPEAVSKPVHRITWFDFEYEGSMLKCFFAPFLGAQGVTILLCYSIRSD